MKTNFFIRFTAACISIVPVPLKGSILCSRLFPFCFYGYRLSPSGLPALSSISMTSTSAPSSADIADGLVVNHDAEKKIFFINLVGEPERAVIEYEVTGPTAVDLYHTGVPPSQRGKGIGKILAKAALDHFVSQGIDMKLSCSYLQKYFGDNPLPAHKDRVLNL